MKIVDKRKKVKMKIGMLEMWFVLKIMIKNLKTLE